MVKVATMDVAIVRRQFDSLLGLGIPKVSLENALGLSRDNLVKDSIRIPVTSNIEMIKKAVQLAGPEITIKLGAMATMEVVGILGKIMENCSNLREASDQFIRFQNLCFGLTRFQKRIEGDYSVLTHSFTHPVSDYEHKLITEVNFSVCAAAMRNLIEKDITFHEVWFSYEEPDYSEFYRNHFRSTLKFNQAEDAIVMHRELGAAAVPGSYSHLKDILSEYAENLLAALEEERTFKDKVKRIVSELLPKGSADIENVSSKLCMSRWTLNRRLRKEGTRFQEILMELRREFATAYLDNRNLTIAEIAFLLGYSEQSAFFRAFKKWTGITPTQYREQRDSELPKKLVQ